MFSERIFMKEPTIDRLLLMHELWERKLSDTTIEAVVQIIERTRIEQGHSKAEAVAKEIREIIETENSESGVLKKLNQMKKHL